jgi:hypothetical protein
MSLFLIRFKARIWVTISFVTVTFQPQVKLLGFITNFLACEQDLMFKTFTVLYHR